MFFLRVFAVGGCEQTTAKTRKSCLLMPAPSKANKKSSGPDVH
jgi:hypothetical protein